METFLSMLLGQQYMNILFLCEWDSRAGEIQYDKK